MVTQELEGKVAVVTGAAGGIGLETSKVLAAAGAKVVLADLPSTELAEAAESVSSFGEAAHHPVDVSDETDVKTLISFAVGRFGRLDVVDNNAARLGIAEDRDVLHMNVDLWDRSFAVNARGTMLMCKHAIPAMIDAGGGSIINIASGTAAAGDDFATAYACTKGAIQTLTRYVATQYGHLGIRCNAIAPGLVKTPALAAGLPEPVQELFIAQKLVGRLGEPRDVAEAVLFLASDRSSFITGQIIPVDGGFFAHVPTVASVRAMMRAAAE